MKTLSPITIILLAGVVAVLCEQLDYGAVAAVEVQLEAEGGRTEILPFLPACVTIRVRNTGPTTATVTPLSPETTAPAMYSFFVRHESGQVFYATFADFTMTVFLADGLGWHPSRNKARISPNQTWVRDYCLGYAIVSESMTTAPLPVFARPGRYTIHLEMPFLLEGGASSNEITVSVREPETAADRKPYDLIRSSSYTAILLAPPGRGTYSCSILREIRFPLAPGAVELGTRILSECGDSVYTPYAKLLVATDLCERSLPTSDSSRSRVPDVQKRAEGVRLLRQCAEDPRLPRRHREEALSNIQSVAEALDQHLQFAARNSVPSIESVLGVAKLDLGPFSPAEVFAITKQIADGVQGHIFGRQWLEATFTPQQIDLLKAAVTSNLAIAQAGGVSPLQRELKEHAAWARNELRRIPWRDPNTGELRVTSPR